MMVWEELFRLVATGQLPVGDAARLLRAVAAGADQIAHGQDLTPDQVRALAGEALPVALAVAQALFPAAAPEISAGAVLLSLAHKMTPEEEAAWMARASGGPNG